MRPVGSKRLLRRRAALLVVVHHVLEASALHERHPLRRLAHILQRLAALEHPLLAVLHAVLSQDLQIQSLLVAVKVLVLILSHVALCCMQWADSPALLSTIRSYAVSIYIIYYSLTRSLIGSLIYQLFVAVSTFRCEGEQLAFFYQVHLAVEQPLQVVPHAEELHPDRL